MENNTLFALTLKIEAYHKPTETWHIYKATHNTRARSRKHAIDKGLRVVMGWPGYADREGHQDWTVEASASLNTQES